VETDLRYHCNDAVDDLARGHGLTPIDLPAPSARAIALNDRAIDKMIDARLAIMHGTHDVAESLRHRPSLTHRTCYGRWPTDTFDP
jgi:hypothetical protein